MELQTKIRPLSETEIVLFPKSVIRENTNFERVKNAVARSKEAGLEDGIIEEDVWRIFAEDLRQGYELPVWGENFSRQELREMPVKCYKRFYLRTQYVLHAAARARGAGGFKRKMRAGLSVLTMTPDQKVYGNMARSQVRDIVPRSPIDVHTG